MQIDQFDPSRKFDPLGRGDLMASMNTELDVYVEFYDATVRGKTRLVDVNRDYIALNPMWSLAKTIDEAFAIQKDHEPLLVVKRGGDNFQPATVFGSNNADWAAWKLLAS